MVTVVTCAARNELATTTSEHTVPANLPPTALTNQLRLIVASGLIGLDSNRFTVTFRSLAFHHPAKPGLGIVQMAREFPRAMLQLAFAEKLIKLAVHWNQSAGIVVTAIHQHHAHADL